MQVHDEWVPHVRKDITFSLGISDEVLSQNLPLAKSFHGVQLARVLIPDQEDIAETATSKLLQWLKVLLAIVSEVLGVVNSIDVLNRRNSGRQRSVTFGDLVALGALNVHVSAQSV